ncbi:MAG: hypothetical protein U0234_31710 [Sandaracinus sp.]
MAQDGNRTIQIDALTDDVQLVSTGSDEGEAPTSSAVPPPLPPRPVAGPSRSRALVALVVAAVLGTVFALALVHFVFPSSGTPAPETPSPTAAPVRQVQIDEAVVIRSGTGSAPAAE